MNQPVDTSRRDLIIGILIGVLVLGFIIYGVLNMGAPIAVNNLTGVIVEKKFTPRPEQQVDISLKRKEMRTREIDGEYLFEVKADGRVYLVPVEKRVYEANKVGSSFTFPRPPEE